MRRSLQRRFMAVAAGVEDTVAEAVAAAISAGVGMAAAVTTAVAMAVDTPHLITAVVIAACDPAVDMRRRTPGHLRGG